MLAGGITIHKSQGQTLDAAVVHLDTAARTPALAFVAMSRVRKRSDLYFASGLRLMHIQDQHGTLKARLAEEARLAALAQSCLVCKLVDISGVL